MIALTRRMNCDAIHEATFRIMKALFPSGMVDSR